MKKKKKKKKTLKCSCSYDIAEMGCITSYSSSYVNWDKRSASANELLQTNSATSTGSQNGNDVLPPAFPHVSCIIHL
jgi:hypothetical protein